MAELCPCIYPDINPDEDENPDGLCACDHAGDEHDERGQCRVEIGA